MNEIMNQLTSREKKLLYFLLCFLIVMGGILLIVLPALEKHDELVVSYDNALIENTQKKSELTQIEQAKSQLKTKKESLNKIIKEYNPILKDEKIDELLTTRILVNGLTPKTLQIGEITDVTLSTTKDNNKDKETSTYMKQVSIALTVSGSLNQIMNLVDDLNDMKGVEIAGLSYTKTTDNQTTLQTPTTVTSATLNVMIYMAKQ